MPNKNLDKEFRVQSILIHKGHSMYQYFTTLCVNANNLSNASNYYVRQVYFGLIHKKTSQGSVIKAIDEINGAVDALNLIRSGKSGKKKSASKSSPDLFKSLNEGNPFLSYELLDGFFKQTKNVDYYSLPAQCNQQIIKEVFESWKSYFAAKKSYTKNPSVFTGTPKPPKYAKKGALKTVTLTNQICYLKGSSHLKFPNSKEVLNIGHFIHKNSFKIQEVRVVPSHNKFKVEIIYISKEKPKPILDAKKAIAIDLGIDNFTTITNNFNEKPLIIKGKAAKSKNQLFNKLYAKHYSELREGKSPKQGQFTSKKIEAITLNRNNFMHDFIHKVSRQIVNYCLIHSVANIVVGKNSGWKQEINIGSINNQKFVQIPHSVLIEKLIYKAKEMGINVTVREESYTSKASALDKDFIPVYGEVDKPKFSGKRIKRGLYKSKDGKLINADINGSLNILRKEIGDFEFNERVIQNPEVVKNIFKVSGK